MMCANVAKIVRSRVEDIAVGEVFSYEAFGVLAAENRTAVAQALSRLVRDGKIASLGRGKFYRPRQTRFGPIPPSPKEQLREALKNGYVSGAEAFNRLGITTQVPAVIEIASPRKAHSTTIGYTHVKFVRSYVDAVPEDVLPLMLLDALKQYKKIQDASPDKVFESVMLYVEKMSTKEIDVFVVLAKSYPPRVRAMVGALLELVGLQEFCVEISKTLNPATTYRVGVLKSIPGVVKKRWRLTD